jgi:hypothetical protein
MTERRFVIVENAGYEGERDITHFPTLREAMAYQRGHYEPDEVEELRVDIRQDWTDENGEEHQEYVY